MRFAFELFAPLAAADGGDFFTAPTERHHIVALGSLGKISVEIFAPTAPIAFVFHYMASYISIGYIIIYLIDINQANYIQ